MSVWSSYQARLAAKGTTKREVRLNREKDYLTRKLKDTLSYHTVLVNNMERNMAIINSDNLNQKTLCSLPGEEFDSGSLVFWENNYWLVTQVDANNELYTKGTMLQCNHLLRWVADDGTIIERWCIVEDGTRYLTGEVTAMYDIKLHTGDARISITIPRDEYTVKLGRDRRFLIDDPDSETVLAYRLTKPFKTGSVYNGKGVLVFVLTEVNTEDDDNLDLRIADYYTYFPRETSPDMGSITEPGKKVWL